MVYALSNKIQVDGKRVVSLEPVKTNEIIQIEVEDSSPDGGLYFGHGRALISGRRIKTDHIPQQMKIDVGTVIPDYGSSHYLKFVSDRFKSVVEAVEPGVHQFIPFQIVGAHKALLADMWFMVVCNRLDSVDREHTTLVLYRGRDWVPHQDISREEWPSDFNPNREPRFVFNLSQIGDHHLWYDKHSGYGPYLSDALADALTAGDLTGINLVKQEAV
ncbi:MAG: DUF1629 domain-containing protein [Sphingorhabdus sp.]